MATHDHWLKCGLYGQMYDLLAFFGERPSPSFSVGSFGAKEEMHMTHVRKAAWCSREEVLHPLHPALYRGAVLPNPPLRLHTALPVSPCSAHFLTITPG